MNLNNLIRYSSLLLVGLLAGNAFAFVLGMGPAMEKLSASSYMAFHESLQRSFLSWTPSLCILLVMFLALELFGMRRRWRNLDFFFVLFALLCVLDELMMTWVGNFPLNTLIHSWVLQGVPMDWGQIRAQWLYFMYWRCALLVASFSLLLASSVIMNSESQASRDVAAAF
ncbi:MAG TPA: DUF1772 domain-containing protein [Bdellovibrio sp.]|uniref:DUF1772 domain-containing protein n=1 Tax=Bdellovibrio sp. TaxID=28201 RepID=UPI002EDEDA5D